MSRRSEREAERRRGLLLSLSLSILNLYGVGGEHWLTLDMNTFSRRLGDSTSDADCYTPRDWI